MVPGPYRTNDAAVRHEGAHHGDATPASSIPLGVIALTFFLPMVRVCDERAVSPLREATRSAPSFFAITPVFVSAAVLFVAIVHAHKTKRSATGAALVSMAWSVLAAAFSTIAGLGEGGWMWVIFAITAVSAPLYGFAWSSRGARRLALLVDAYLFASFPLALLVGLTGEYFGAYLFTGAYVMLVLVRAFERVRRWWVRRAIVVPA